MQKSLECTAHKKERLDLEFGCGPPWTAYEEVDTVVLVAIKIGTQLSENLYTKNFFSSK